jgi:hypothetical protein
MDSTSYTEHSAEHDQIWEHGHDNIAEAKTEFPLNIEH